MATLASTAVTAGELSSPFPLAGGLALEVFRCAGGAAADTVALTPKFGRFVLGAWASQASTNGLSTLGTDTNVTLALTASSTTSVTFDAFLLVRT